MKLLIQKIEIFLRKIINLQYFRIYCKFVNLKSSKVCLSIHLRYVKDICKNNNRKNILFNLRHILNFSNLNVQLLIN